MGTKLVAIGLALASTLLAGCTQAQQEENVHKGKKWAVRATDSGHCEVWPKYEYFNNQQVLKYSFLNGGGLSDYWMECPGYGIRLRAECIDPNIRDGGSPIKPTVMCGTNQYQVVMGFEFKQGEEDAWQHTGVYVDSTKAKGSVSEFIVGFGPLTPAQKMKMYKDGLTVSISGFLDLPTFSIALPVKKPARIPLMVAVLADADAEEIGSLIKDGADVNQKFYCDMTPLFAAAEFNTHPEVVTRLVHAGADVNAAVDDLATGKKMTALGLAARRNANGAVVEALVKSGAAMKDCDVLCTAIWLGQTNASVVRALVSTGVDLNGKGGAYGWTPLQYAVKRRQPELVAVLIDAGADVAKVDWSGANQTIRDHPLVQEAIRKAKAK